MSICVAIMKKQITILTFKQIKMKREFNKQVQNYEMFL